MLPSCPLCLQVGVAYGVGFAVGPVLGGLLGAARPQATAALAAGGSALSMLLVALMLPARESAGRSVGVGGWERGGGRD